MIIENGMAKSIITLWYILKHGMKLLLSTHYVKLLISKYKMLYRRSLLVPEWFSKILLNNKEHTVNSKLQNNDSKIVGLKNSSGFNV